MSTAESFRVLTDKGGNVWLVVEHADGTLGCTVANLPPVYVDAPRALDEMSDAEVTELIRAEVEPRP